MAQPARAGNLFYFLFSAADQALIDETTIVVTDEPYGLAPAAGQPCAQSLRIQFALKNPTGALPKVRPLSPGTLTFYADTVAGKAPPTRATADVANIGSWPTVGTLRLELNRPGIRTRLAEITGLPVVPSNIWYSKVELTSAFIGTTLVRLRQTETLQNTTTRHPTSSPERLKDLIMGLFKQKPLPQIREGTTQANDHLATVQMPSVVAQVGQVELRITMAYNPKPFDGLPADFENRTNIPIEDPAHPSHGSIPARHVYRSARAHATGNMADAAAGNPVADAILARNNSTPDYFTVQFTRIWKLADECSVHFPSQRIQVTRALGSYSFERRLPCHGMVFAPVTPLEQLASMQFSLNVITDSTDPKRAMWWLSGGVPEVWKDQAGNWPIALNLSAAATPHVLMRRRMSQEIIYDRAARPTSPHAACTYFSMRRAVRALVNNRVAGGRLNFEVWYNTSNAVKGKNTAATRALLKEALGNAVANVVLDGKPDHTGMPEAEAPKLQPVLETFFDQRVPPETVDGTTSPDPDKTYGWAGYYVWQTGYSLSKKTNPNTRAFHDLWLGGGGAGALIALGLAADYAVNPGQTTSRNAGETDTSYRSRIAEDILSAVLEPGAELQFWDEFTDLDALRNRTLDHDARGHSPTFLRYADATDPQAGMWVIDQDRETFCRRIGTPGAYKLEWDPNYSSKAWIAANWIE